MWPLRNRITAPQLEDIASGSKYTCVIDPTPSIRSSSGTVYDEHGVVRWRYGFRANPSGRGWGNPFNKPDFVVADANGQAELVIRRVSFVPPIFNIMDGDLVLGRIRLRSLLRNKYAIDINGVNSWTFRMPLFTVRFGGYSHSCTDIWVIVGPGKMQWNILIRPNVSERHLVAALAFIHSEWWNYS